MNHLFLYLSNIQNNLHLLIYCGDGGSQFLGIAVPLKDFHYGVMIDSIKCLQDIDKGNINWSVVVISCVQQCLDCEGAVLVFNSWGGSKLVFYAVFFILF